MNKRAAARPPEHWRCDAGHDSVAVLDIPGALDRRRVFDVDVTLLVSVPADIEAAWHALSVELDGRQQWQRRIPSNSPGQTDGLDYHCRLTLEVKQALRVRAVAAVGGGSRVRQLLIEAREDLS
ncbi:MAG: hypothetical protein Q8K24_07870 [Hydrogenophaga sp.]|nr:hypothetical protein [Hydrogenophaga sp.]